MRSKSVCLLHGGKGRTVVRVGRTGVHCCADASGPLRETLRDLTPQGELPPLVGSSGRAPLRPDPNPQSLKWRQHFTGSGLRGQHRTGGGRPRRKLESNPIRRRKVRILRYFLLRRDAMRAAWMAAKLRARLLAPDLSKKFWKGFGQCAGFPVGLQFVCFGLSPLVGCRIGSTPRPIERNVHLSMVIVPGALSTERDQDSPPARPTSPESFYGQVPTSAVPDCSRDIACGSQYTKSAC